MDLTQPSDNFETYRRHMPHWRASHVIYFITGTLHVNSSPLEPDERSLITSTIEHFNKQRYWLLAYVVMDDHAHILVRLSPDSDLEKVMHSWKSYSANQLQRRFGRGGVVWQDESMDRIVRDSDELKAKLNYIGNNAVKRWPETKDYRWMRFVAEEH